MTSEPRAVAAMVRYIDDRVIKKGMRLLLRLGLVPRAFALPETTGRPHRAAPPHPRSATA
ncbi:MAG: hypothetical protein ACRDQU_00625 [Pseudonocardiaceae bacterium]